MSVHFLLKAKARTLSLAQIFRMTDEEAATHYSELRLASNNGNPICTACSYKGKMHNIKSRHQLRGKDCGHTFSTTSNTIFSNRKMPLQFYLAAAIAIYVNASKSLSLKSIF